MIACLPAPWSLRAGSRCFLGGSCIVLCSAADRSGTRSGAVCVFALIEQGNGDAVLRPDCDHHGARRARIAPRSARPPRLARLHAMGVVARARVNRGRSLADAGTLPADDAELCALSRRGGLPHGPLRACRRRRPATAEELRYLAGILLAIYFVCVFPANIKNAIEGLSVEGLPAANWYYWARLLFQPLVIWWTLYSSAAIDWPLRQRTTQDAPRMTREDRR